MPRGPIDLVRRCARCLFPPEACLCAAVVPSSTKVRLLVVRHASELRRPSNSGRWAALALPGARLVDYALPGEPLDLPALIEPGAAVLFPSPHPPTLLPAPRQLVVLDATWAQARRMVQRLPALQRLPRVSLPAPLARVRPMREATVDGGLTTLEAIAAALRLLGEPTPAAALERLHRDAMDRAWTLRLGRARSA